MPEESVSAEHHVVIIGAGITGLSCAHSLLTAAPHLRVTLLESQPTTGGVIRTSPFAGLSHVDEAADAFLLRVPFVAQLANEVGLGEQLTSPVSAHASVWRNGLHRLPAGLLLGVPTQLSSLATSRLISPLGKLRAALDLALPRTSVASDSIGTYMRRRFGNEVHNMLIDPLVGSIYAADTDHFSLEMVPQLSALASKSRSVLLTARRMPQPAANISASPIFGAPLTGMGALITATQQAVEKLGGTIRLNSHVSSVEPASSDGKYFVHFTANGVSETLTANYVVVCSPAQHSAGFFSESAPQVSQLLAQSSHASVVMVALAIPKESLPQKASGSGYLVPKPEQRFITAVSFASQKWAHLNTTDSAILRVSLGRDGMPLHEHSDEELTSFVLADIKRHLLVDLEPTALRITRWKESFPQYRPHHVAHVEHLENHLSTKMPRVHLAGASFRGIGVPSCIQQGVATAQKIISSIQ
ncbi:MAG: protoporphyrinogen oxidase [Actinobacteria bacterium]|nr:protoporphyrinogen oxidase [Actinomycetota bacterium]